MGSSPPDVSGRGPLTLIVDPSIFLWSVASRSVHMASEIPGLIVLSSPKHSFRPHNLCRSNLLRILRLVRTVTQNYRTYDPRSPLEEWPLIRQDLVTSHRAGATKGRRLSAWGFSPILGGDENALGFVVRFGRVACITTHPMGAHFSHSPVLSVSGDTYRCSPSQSVYLPRRNC